MNVTSAHRTDKVVIFDTTLRDGEQSAGVNFSTRDKLDISLALEAMRVDVIEAGFPAASPAELANVRAVAQQVQSSGVCALARCRLADVETAADALSEARRGRIHVFIGSSVTHLTGQLRKAESDALAMLSAAIRLARDRVAEVEFSAMDATRAEPATLSAMIRAAITAGASIINVPDTVGIATPAHITRLFQRLLEDVPELAAVTLSFHGQDDLGLATANALAAIEAGARQVEVAVNGIGERAGNTALEEVAVALLVHGKAMGVHADVDCTRIHGLSELVRIRSGMPIAPNKAIVGRNAFRHASGIHQDGILKERATFEAVDPAWVGHPLGAQIVLGKLSGRSGFLSKAQELGLVVAPEARSRLFARFQRLADLQPEVSDEDVRRLVLADELASP